MQKEMRAARREVERMGLQIGVSSSLGRLSTGASRKRWQQDDDEEEEDDDAFNLFVP